MPAPTLKERYNISWKDVGLTTMELEREHTCTLDFGMGTWRAGKGIDYIRWEITCYAYYRRGKPDQVRAQCSVPVGGGRGAATHPAAALRAAYGACEALEERREELKRNPHGLLARLPGFE